MAETLRKDREQHQREYSYFVANLNILKSWASSQVILHSFPGIIYEVINIANKGGEVHHRAS